MASIFSILLYSYNKGDRKKKEEIQPLHSYLFLLSISNYMILDFMFDFNCFSKISHQELQELYDESVMLHLSEYTCPNPDCMNEHISLSVSTKYTRYIYFDRDQSVSISIIVLKCPVCGAYHAVLPSFVLPFCSYSYPFIIKTLSLFYFGKNKRNKSKTCRDMHISRKTLEHFLSIFSFEFIRSLHQKKVRSLCNALIKLRRDTTPLFPFLSSYHSDGLIFLTAHIRRAFRFSFFHPPNKKMK